METKFYNVVLAFGQFDNPDQALDVCRESTKLISDCGYQAKCQVYETTINSLRNDNRL